LPVLAMPPEAGTHYGVVRRQLERAGEIIGGNDLWIAAQALAVEGLSVEHWVGS
jgi:tRNA(fMet)-specific endonuclease VapC